MTAKQIQGLEFSFSRIHTHLQSVGQTQSAAGLRAIFQELKTLALQALENIGQPPESFEQQILATLKQIKGTVEMTDKNVDKILSGWGDFKISVGKLVALAQEAVTVEPDDPRADEIAQEMAQLKAQIDPIVNTPAPSQAQVSAASAAASGATGSTGATGQTGSTGATGTTGPATAPEATAATGATGTASASAGVAGAPATGATGAAAGGVSGTTTGGVSG